MLFDEPLSNLDAKLRVEMRAEIKLIHADLGLTSIYVTHDQAEALSMSDRIVVLRNGVLMQSGSPQEIPTTGQKNTFVADFMGFRNFFHGEDRRAVGWRGRGHQRQSRPCAPGPATVLAVGTEAVMAIQAGGHPARSRATGVGHRPCRAGSRSSNISAAKTGSRRQHRRLTTRIMAAHGRRICKSATQADLGFPVDKVVLATGRIAEKSMRAAANDERSEFDVLALCCLLPSLAYVLCMFVYPFLYGIYLSLQPQKVAGFSLANYFAFFSDPYQYGTIWITFSLAVPTTVIVLVLSLCLAYGMRRGFFMERTITTILIMPISLGVITC